MSKFDVVQTVVTLLVVILAAGTALLWVLTRDVGDHKMKQQLDRTGEYMARAANAIEIWERSRGELPEPDEDSALPAEVGSLWAETQGGRPFHEEEGRLLRMDLFSRNGPFSQPLLYARRGEQWALISRGPNLEFDVTAEDLNAGENWREGLMQRSWDPTNGTWSSGDVTIFGIGSGPVSPESP